MFFGENKKHTDKKIGRSALQYGVLSVFAWDVFTQSENVEFFMSESGKQGIGCKSDLTRPNLLMLAVWNTKENGSTKI